MLPLVVLLPFIVYLYTLCPTIFFGDSPEIVAAVKILGVPHPTGFPTYLLLAKLFSFLPLGEFAFRVNLFSAFISALNAGLIYLFLKRNSVGEKIAVISSLTYAFGQTVWLHATYAQTYSLAAFFGLITLLEFQEYCRSRSRRRLYLAFLLAGLGFGVHMTVLMFFLGGLLLVVLDLKKDKVTFRELLVGIPFFFLGLLIFLYIPIRAGQNPAINWDKPDNFSAFFYYIRQKQWGYMMFDRGWYQSLIFLQKVTGFFVHEFTPLGLLLALYGTGVMFFKKRPLFYLVSLIIGVNIAFFFVYGNQTNLEVLYRYFLPTYFGATVAIAYAFESLGKKLGRASLFFFLLPLVCLLANYRYSSNRGNTFALDHARNLLATASPDGLLILQTEDDIFPLLYSRYVLNESPGVTIYDRSGNVFGAVYKMKNQNQVPKNEVDKFKNEKDLEIISQSPSKNAFFGDTDNPELKFRAKGILFSGAREEKKADFETDDVFALYKLPDIKKINPSFKNREEYGRYLLMKARAYLDEGRKEEAEKLIKEALGIAGDANYVIEYAGYLYLSEGEEEKAKEAFLLGTKKIRHLASPYYHLGIIYLQQENPDVAEAKRALEKAVEIEPDFVEAREVLDKLVYFQLESQLVKSLDQLEKEAASNPDQAAVQNQLGVAYGQKGETEKAIAAFQKAITLDPNLASAHFNLGNAYMNLLSPKIGEAREEFEKAIALDPKLSTAYLNLGSICAYKLMDYGCAISAWEKFLEKEPTSPERKNIELEIMRLKGLGGIRGN